MGRTPLLDAQQLEELVIALSHRPADGGVWSRPKVARWIEQKTQRETIGHQRGWNYLKKCNYSWKIPRPKHRKSEANQQQNFKEQLPEKIAGVAHKHPDSAVELWFMNEHRVGLKPIIRRSWSLRGSKPSAIVEHRYEWLYVYSFVHPNSGGTHWYLIPTVNIDWFNVVLANFATEAGIGEKKKYLLVLERAGWHRSEKVELPLGVELESIPPYSPELQPAERLWKLVDESLVNEHFESLEALEKVLAKSCCTLAQKHEQIHNLTAYHWLPCV